MEDALKRLDKLTQEEARMAVAQILKVTHTVDEGLRGVADTVVTIDNTSAKSQFPLQLYCLFGFMASICKVESSGKFIKLYFFGLIWPYDGRLCQNFLEFGSV